MPQAIHDVRRDPRFYAQVDEAFGFNTRSMVCVPVYLDDGRLLGVIEVLNKVSDKEFTPDVRFTADKDTLDLEHEADALALVMFVLSSTGGGECTANFRAPLVFNVRNQRGLQVVNREDRHELQRSVSLETYPLSVHS